MSYIAHNFSDKMKAIDVCPLLNSWNTHHSNWRHQLRWTSLLLQLIL